MMKLLPYFFFFKGASLFEFEKRRNTPVLTVSVPLVGRLGPHDVSDADVDWRMCREG